MSDLTNFIEKMYKKFPWVNKDTGLLFLRIGMGVIFLMTGWIKISDMTSTVEFFASLGFSVFWAYLVTAVELLGGLTVLLGLGVYTRVAAKLLAIVMIVAIYLLHIDNPAAMAPIALLFMTLTLMCTGPGKYSVVRERLE
jgi:putative oxidoreductase